MRRREDKGRWPRNALDSVLWDAKSWNDAQMLSWLKRMLGGSTSVHSPLPPIELVSAACPYCGVVQEPPPTRRKKCLDCGEVIFTRTDRETRKKYLLTEAESKRQAVDSRDARFNELSLEVQRASQTADWGALSMALRGQASILFAEGRPHHEVSVEAVKASLMQMQPARISHVRIATVQDERVCDYCAALHGKVFSIRQALRNPPIPGPRCTDGVGQNRHGGRCRCVYVAVIPEIGR